MQKVLLPGVLVLVLLFGGYIWYTSRTPPVVGVQVGVQDESIVTYTSVLHGISFQYPNTYRLREIEVGMPQRGHYSMTFTERGALANIPQNGEGPPTITVDIFQNNLDKLGVEAWVRGTNFSNFKLSPDGAIASTTVDGAPALSYSWDGLYRGESTVFAHKDNIVMLSVMYLSPSDQIRTDFAQALASLRLN